MIAAWFVAEPNPVPSRPTSFATTRSAPLRASFARPAASTSVVSAANATTTHPGGRIRAISLTMSGVGSSTRSGTPSSFFSFVSTTCFGRKSATAAAMTTASASARWASTAARISSADVTRSTTTFGGGATVPGPSTSRTCAPRRAASDATAMPMMPLEWLPMNRTGSIAS